MASITVDTYLDDGTLRTTDETWNMNGGVLTIRTDTRWHVGAPAAMTGSLGNLTISSVFGGGIFVDARNVRWLAYDTGAGNVPAIGTTITQGGVSGYLLGVWPDLASAPTAVGAAMPTTGYIKFREVTGGAFSAGALTGIGANATAADTLGWVEVVVRQVRNITIPRLGYFRTRGGLFELGTTNGSANQIIQTPTNGGGNNTFVPAVWIETSPGSGVYDRYPGLISTWFTTNNLGTDDRSKFVLADTNGRIRIGGDGTNTMGYVPPAGCKIVMPNIILRQTSLASGDATNDAPTSPLTSRPEFSTTLAGVIDIEYAGGDWYGQFTSAYELKLKYYSTFDRVGLSNVATYATLENVVVGSYLSLNITLQADFCTSGFIAKNCKFFRANAVAGGTPVQMSGSANFILEDCETGVIESPRSTGVTTFTNCSNFVLRRHRDTNAMIRVSVSPNWLIEDYTYVDQLKGTTTTAGARYAIEFANASDNGILDGIDFGGYTNVHPYNGVAQITNCANVTIRNGGTRAAPIGGTVNPPNFLFMDTNARDIRIQNIHLTAIRSVLTYSPSNTTTNALIQDCTTGNGSNTMRAANTTSRGNRASGGHYNLGQSSVYGSHFATAYTSDTEGIVWLAHNEPTPETADQFEVIAQSANSGFTSGGILTFPGANDEVIWTSPYFILGFTGFANVAPVFNGTYTGFIDFDYDLDTGSGFSGTWKTLDTTNLTAETISPSTGFRIKIREKTNTANINTFIRYLVINMETTLVAQTENTYPLDFSTISVSGYDLGARVQLFDVTNDVELYNDVPTETTLNFSTPYEDTFVVRARIMKVSGVTAYEFIETVRTVGVDGVEIFVEPRNDAIYAENAIDGSTVTGIEIDDASLRINVDSNTITFQEIYAYETYWLQTEEGIRDEARFIEAVDTVNYKIFDFKIKNVSSPSAKLQITGAYPIDGNTGIPYDIIDDTGGSIFLAPPHVIAQGAAEIAADVWAHPINGKTAASRLEDADDNAELASIK